MAHFTPQTASTTSGPGFADVPAHLRPSAFRAWLDQVPATPRTDDELEAAYGGATDANPYSADNTAYSEAQRRVDVSEIEPFAHWREMVADQRHHDAYIGWLTDHGLTIGGRAPREWRWTAFKRWEQSRCAS